MGSCCQWEEGADQDKRIIVFKTLSIQIICQPHQMTTPTSAVCVSAECLSDLVFFFASVCGKFNTGRKVLVSTGCLSTQIQNAKISNNHVEPSQGTQQEFVPQLQARQRDPSRQRVRGSNQHLREAMELHAGRNNNHLFVFHVQFLFHCLLPAKLSFTISKWVRHLLIFSKLI